MSGSIGSSGRSAVAASATASASSIKAGRRVSSALRSGIEGPGYPITSGSASERRLSRLGPANPVLSSMDVTRGEAGVTGLACGLADVLDPVRTHPGRQLRPAERERPAWHPATITPVVPQLEGAPQVANSLLRFHIADQVVEPHVAVALGPQERVGLRVCELHCLAEIRDRRSRVLPQDLVHQGEAEERRRRSGLVPEFAPN